MGLIGHTLLTSFFIGKPPKKDINESPTTTYSFGLHQTPAQTGDTALNHPLLTIL